MPAHDLPRFRANLETLRNGRPDQRHLAEEIVQLIHAAENVAALAASIESPEHLADWSDFVFVHGQAVRAHVAKHYPTKPAHAA